jgi:hypothetical protein
MKTESEETNDISPGIRNETAVRLISNLTDYSNLYYGTLLAEYYRELFLCYFVSAWGEKIGEGEGDTAVMIPVSLRPT